MTPARIPIIRASYRRGLIRMMARQYIAIMKLGFIPAVKKAPTKSLRTAPAASSTPTRIISVADMPFLDLFWIVLLRMVSCDMKKTSLNFKFRRGGMKGMA